MAKSNKKDTIIDAEVVTPKRTRRTKAQMAEDANTVEVELLDADVLEEPAHRLVQDIKSQFTVLQEDAYVVSQKLAEDISMLELDETKDMITAAIHELESFAGANEAVSIGFMSKIGSGLLALPGAKTIAGLVTDVKTEADKQSLASGNIKEAAERLFKTLENKQGTLENTTGSVMEISTRREADLETQEEMEAELISIIEDEDSSAQEVFQARNMLISVKEALIQSSSKIDQVSIIIEAAQSSTFAITSLLPKIKNNFLDDLTIATGLNHLLQYKEMFDSTLRLVNNIEEHNFAKINKAMIDVVDLNINTSQTERLTRMSNDRLKANDVLIEKTKTQIKLQTKSLEELSGVQDKMTLIGNRQTAALIGSTSADKNVGTTSTGAK